MIDAIAAAARGLQTEARRFNGAARDIANANTPGYKPAGAPAAQGALLATGSPLDLGIAGGEDFRVIRGDGSPGYTRNGAFRVDAQGRLVTGSGEPVALGITVPDGATGLQISPKGEVSAAVGGALVPLGRIELAGLGEQPGEIVQGAFEASGTDLADATVTQITSSRTYSALASVIRTADEMQGTLVDMLA
jgi:flagellar basal-body rod protein FlgG